MYAEVIYIMTHQASYHHILSSIFWLGTDALGKNIVSRKNKIVK